MATLVRAGKCDRAAIARDFTDRGSEDRVVRANTALPATGTTTLPRVRQSAVTQQQIARLKALNEECKRKILAGRERLTAYRATLEEILDAYYGVQ